MRIVCANWGASQDQRAFSHVWTSSLFGLSRTRLSDLLCAIHGLSAALLRHGTALSSQDSPMGGGGHHCNDSCGHLHLDDLHAS